MAINAVRRIILVCLFLVAGVAIPAARSDAAQLTLTWTDNSHPPANEDGFRIERAASEAGPFTLVINTAADIVQHVDTELPPGARFCYRVLAFNTVGQSDPSNMACGITAGIAAPTNLQATP